MVGRGLYVSFEYLGFADEITVLRLAWKLCAESSLLVLAHQYLSDVTANYTELVSIA